MKILTSYLRLAALFVCAAAMTGCTASRSVNYRSVDLDRAMTEIAPEALLDVGVVIFDPGLDEDEENDFIFPEVRRAEARYMPYHLKSTLEKSGYWGSVWVLPERSEAVDLVVWGRIDRSNGLELRLRVGAWDATGREWLNKDYVAQLPEKAYSRYRDRTQDPYQPIFNEIANDLLAARGSLDSNDLVRVREVAELRYAAELVPAAFDDYLEQDRRGEWQVRKLPAENDPMLARMRKVREREYLLVDTLNEYYASLYYDLATPYEDWRKMSREETLRYQDLKRSARIRQLLGLAAILGGVACSSSENCNSGVSTVAIVGGIEGLKSGFGKSAEANIHRESVRELGKSFDAEAEPLVVEVEGQTRRLTGNAEEKYREWRKLLQDIYARETGFPASAELDPDAMPSTPD